MGLRQFFRDLGEMLSAPPFPLPPQMPAPPDPLDYVRRPPAPQGWSGMNAEQRSAIAMAFAVQFCTVATTPERLERFAWDLMRGWDDEIIIRRKLEMMA